MLKLPVKIKTRPGPRPNVRPEAPKLHDGSVGPRPLVWRSGPDPVRHRQWIAFGRARCQARFRDEPWDLTFDEYEELWRGRWHLRGRTVDTLCLSRIDYDQGWTLGNVEIITRSEHNQRQRLWRYSRLT